MKRREIQTKFSEIVEFAGVEQFIDTPVKRYSSGMSVRLAFAVAAHLEPEILLVDEVLAVGDAEFQRRCLGRMEDLSQSGRTVLFVSHQMQAVAQLCDRAIWLDSGQIVRDGPSAEVVAQYLQSGVGSRLEPRVAGSRRPRRVTGSCGCARRGSSRTRRRLRGRRRAQSGRDRDRLHGARVDGRPDVPEDQGLGPAGRRRVQRDGHELALARADAARRVRRRRPGSRETCSTKGCTSVDSWHLLARAARSSAITPAAATRSRSTSRIRARETRREAPFTGQWKGVVRPLLEWTTEER